MSTIIKDDKVRKRRRDVGVSSSSSSSACSSNKTTCVVSYDIINEIDEIDNEIGENGRPRKRHRGQSKIDYFFLTARSSFVSSGNSIASSKRHEESRTNQKVLELNKDLPAEVISKCLSFLGSTEDRYALQNTCKLFRDISNSDSMLSNVDVFGDLETGKGCIIQEEDTPATAAASLTVFARAGNLQALYLFGIVKCYCYQDLKNGILMLKMAASRGFVRSSYTLGIILRDSLPNDASYHMNTAASQNYFPALQEILPVAKMKERFGEPNADELRQHLDPVGLNRLLLRDYVNSAELRGMNTSHCWNPHCGKWAYKAGASVRKQLPGPLIRSFSSNFVNKSEVYEELNDAVTPNHALQSHGYNESFDISPNREVGNQNHGAIGIALSSNNHRQGMNSNNPFRREINERLSQRRSQPFHTKDHRGSCQVSKAPETLAWNQNGVEVDRVARMKMCSRCCRAKYCSKLCQVYDWRSSQHKMECQFL
jgi:hypothetical protein